MGKGRVEKGGVGKGEKNVTTRSYEAINHLQLSDFRFQLLVHRVLPLLLILRLDELHRHVLQRRGAGFQRVSSAGPLH